MPTERMIIASFPSSGKAAEAAEVLNDAGFPDVHIRRNTRFGVSQDARYNNPVSHQAESLAALTLYSTNASQDENSTTRVLLGADPSVSGYSARGYGLSGGQAFVLVAFVPEERVDQAVGLIKQQGGEV